LSPDTKTESEKDSVSSSSRTQRSSKSPSPKRHVEKTSEKEENLEDVELEESIAVEKSEVAVDEKSVESSPSEMDIDCKVEVEKTLLKRPREDEAGVYTICFCR
jgi:hypothetical protein